MCGKGVDQTMRSPQQWLILAPETKQKHAFARDGSDGWGFKFNDHFTPDSEIFDVWSMLARPVIASITIQPMQQDCRMGTFDVLSNELIDMIFAYVTEVPKDTVALGLTCEAFWYLASSYIQRSYIRYSAPWAGTKLIFQGSWSTDLPESISGWKVVEDIVDDDHSRKPVARKLFWASWDFDEPVTCRQREKQLRHAMELFKERSRTPEGRWGGIERSITCDGLFPKDRTWMLRNLTTNEFVSYDPQKPEESTEGRKDTKPLRFEDVLLMKTCWTDRAPHGWEDLEIHRGKWASHRFDIVAEEVHLKEAATEWRDVTGESKLEWGAVRNRLGFLKAKNHD